MLFDGNPGYVRGLNLIGMQRRGVSEENIGEIKKCFKMLYGSRANTKSAVEEIRKKIKTGDEVEQLINFLEAESMRGISKKREGAEAISEDTEIEKALLFPDIPEIGI